MLAPIIDLFRLEQMRDRACVRLTYKALALLSSPKCNAETEYIVQNQRLTIYCYDVTFCIVSNVSSYNACSGVLTYTDIWGGQRKK